MDARFSSCFEKMYLEWIKNSLNGSLADVVFVYKEQNKILGFVSLKIKNDFGQIGLISVSEKAQSKGIGNKLIKACDYYLYQHQIKTHKVVTQFDNIAACKLFENHNFTVESIAYIYHL